MNLTVREYGVLQKTHLPLILAINLGQRRDRCGNPRSMRFMLEFTYSISVLLPVG